MRNKKLINKTYYGLYFNKNLSNIIKTYNVKFAKEKVTSFTYLDKVAHKFYGDESLWWVICVFNNIVDPLTELDEKDELLVPLNVKDFVDKL